MESYSMSKTLTASISCLSGRSAGIKQVQKGGPKAGWNIPALIPWFCSLSCEKDADKANHRLN